MKHKKIYLSIVVGLLFFGFAMAQNQKHSKVVVSEADLVSLVKVLKTHQNKTTEAKSETKPIKSN
ncbi:MAG: hypothetical protein ABR595_04425, partial [Psychroflexus sp.]